MGDSAIDFWDTTAEFDQSYNVGVALYNHINGNIYGYKCRHLSSEVDALLAAFQPSRVVLACETEDFVDEEPVVIVFNYFFSKIVNSIHATNARTIFLGLREAPNTDTGSLALYEPFGTAVTGLATDLSANPSAITACDGVGVCHSKCEDCPWCTYSHAPLQVIDVDLNGADYHEVRPTGKKNLPRNINEDRSLLKTRSLSNHLHRPTDLI
jgi:hypothetical protein